MTPTRCGRSPEVAGSVDLDYVYERPALAVELVPPSTLLRLLAHA
jgi:hypothetical protein